MEHENRVVVLIDMDCFYCQVEEKLDPELKGKPIAVVQYNPWKGGGIIAVNYEARARGVTRHMRGDEAKEKCPEIELPSVPCMRGKADITKYRDAGKEVARVLQRFTPLLERASIDEAYLDITTSVQEKLNTLNISTIDSYLMPNTFALGYDSIEEFLADVHSCSNDSIDFDYEHAKRLVVGAVVVSEIRLAVYEETGYRCSAGIAHNKILAKLVCGMNKPDKQTILPKHSVNILYKTLSIKKVKNLGGKFGDTVCELLKISQMGELQNFTEKELQAKIDEKNGTWLYNIARGVDLEPVQARFNPKSIGCCKQLRGKSALLDLDSLRRWLKDLGDEIEDRLEKDALENNRTPKQMVVSFSTQHSDGRDMSSSRSYNFVADDELCGELFSSKALELIMESAEGVKPKDDESNRKLRAPIKFLGISVGKFEDHSESKKTKKIVDYFNVGSANVTKHNDTVNKEMKEQPSDRKNKKNDGKEYILHKFFQVTDKDKIEGGTRIKVETRPVDDKNKTIPDSSAVLEATLANQESFFAKFLNKESTKNLPRPVVDLADQVSENRPSSPVCNVVSCGEDSNDTAYSGSTINMEINKSIALFDDDPAEDIARVSNMRELLNKSTIIATEDVETSETEPQENPTDVKVEEIQQQANVKSFECSECKKIMALDMVETHADYHLALKLRDEERQEVRKEIKEKSNQKLAHADEKRKRTTQEQKNEAARSIASFLVKVDDSVPTEVCSECGKKVPIEKFAEHLDFHEARKLSREINKKSQSYLMGNSVKRKRKTVSPVKKPKVPCTSRSIDSFFR